MLSEEATNTNFIDFGFTPSGLKPTIYRTRGEHGNHYTTDVVGRQSNSQKKKGKKTNSDLQNTAQKSKD